MTSNNFLGLKANLCKSSTFALGRTNGGYWLYSDRNKCLYHYFQMAMWLRKNYTYLSLISLVMVMQLRSAEGYLRGFRKGFNPQSDEDVATLGFLMQKNEGGIQPYDVMTIDEIKYKWKTFLTLFV